MPSASAAYCSRWLLLTSFCAANIMCGIMWLSLASISNSLQEVFQISDSQVNIASSIYLFGFALMAFPAMFLIDSKGLIWSLLPGAALTCVGATIRLVSLTSSSPDFLWCLVGSFIASLGQPFIMASPSELADEWFPPDQRMLTTTVASLSNALGGVLAFGSTPWLLNNYGIRGVLAAQAGASVCVLLLVGIVRCQVTGRKSLYTRLEDDSPSFCLTLAKLLSHRGFLLITLGFILNFSAVCASQELANQMLIPMGITAEDVGEIGVGMSIAGTLFGVAISSCARSVSSQKRCLILLSLFAVLPMCHLWLLMRLALKDLVQVNLAMSLFAAGTFVVWPLAIRLASSITLDPSGPRSGGTIAGLIFLMGELGGTVAGLALGELEPRGIVAGLGALSAGAAACFALVNWPSTLSDHDCGEDEAPMSCHVSGEEAPMLRLHSGAFL